MRSGLPICTPGQYFGELQKAASRMPYAEIETAISTLNQACETAHTVFLCGNGGSAALASHFACDLGKGVSHYSPGARFRVVSLADNVPTITAWANDASYDEIFAEPLSNLVQPDDVLIAISGSGNSRNILRAAEVAGAAGALTIGLTGFEGGKLKPLCDICVVVPSDNMQIIEDLHVSITHAIFTVITNARRKGIKAVAAAGD